MIIYPAIDIKGGRCVRLRQGIAEQETLYYNDPAEPALLWKKAGSLWVHVVDLDGAFSGAPQNWLAVEKIAATGLRVQMGGGLRTIMDVQRAFEAGVARVVIGTQAAADPVFLENLLNQYGDKIAVGVDAKDGMVAVRGWVDTTDINALDLAGQVEAKGGSTIIYTDISRDGMLSGPNFEAQKQMLSAVKLDVIASGGVSSASDIEKFRQMAIEHPNLNGVIIGRALYEGKVDLKEVLESGN